MKWLSLTVLVAIVAGSTAAAYVWVWRDSGPSDGGRNTGSSTTPGRPCGNRRDKRRCIAGYQADAHLAPGGDSAGPGSVPRDRRGKRPGHAPSHTAQKLRERSRLGCCTRDAARIQPWPGCRAEYERIRELYGGWDSYDFEAAIAGRLVAVRAMWRVSDSCVYVLNRVVLPERTGETFGTFESTCPALSSAREKAVGNLTAAGESVYFNLFAARRHRSRRETHENPAVWRMSRRGAPVRQRGWSGLLADGQGDRLLVRKKSALVLASVTERLADRRVFPPTGRRCCTSLLAAMDTRREGTLTDDRVVIQRGDVVHVYDTETGATQATWRCSATPSVHLTRRKHPRRLSSTLGEISSSTRADAASGCCASATVTTRSSSKARS